MNYHIIAGAALALFVFAEPAAAGNPAAVAPLSTGSLKWSGVMINVNGVEITFPWGMGGVNVTCSPKGPTNSNRVLQAHTSFIISVEGGSTCSLIAPNLPAPIAHYADCNGGSASWTRSYSAQPVVIPTNGISTITVTDKLNCDPIARQRRETPPPPQS